MLLNSKYPAFEHGVEIWAIGDVHGCSAEFRALCLLIKEKAPYAVIIQLGDLIDRGPDLIEVFEVCREFNVITILGNHEYNFINENANTKVCRSLTRRVTHDKFNALDKDQQQLILDVFAASLRYIVIALDDSNVTHMLSHSVPTAYACHNLDTVGLSGFCFANTPGVHENHPLIDTVLVHGHQHWNYVPIETQVAQMKGKKTKQFNVDSGCVYGKTLVAFNVMTEEIISVDAEKTYCTHIL